MEVSREKVLGPLCSVCEVYVIIEETLKETGGLANEKGEIENLQAEGSSLGCDLILRRNRKRWAARRIEPGKNHLFSVEDQKINK